jgi:EthD domain
MDDRSPVEYEQAAAFAVSAFGWFRTDLPAEVTRAYWRDVHGTLAARIPGLYQYRQLHLAPPRGGLLASANGVRSGLRDGEEPVSGIAQLLFGTAEDLRTFSTHPFVTEHVFNDEQRLCRRNASMPSGEGTARTLVDRTGETTPQHQPVHPTFVVALQPATGLSRETFWQQAAELIATPWSDHAGVLRLRFTPLEPYDPAGWPSPGVEHAWAPEHQYQAWVELVVRDAAELGGLPRLDPEVVGGAHVYPVREKYTIVHDGRPTDVGLRGWPMVWLIEQAGADNQKAPALLRAVYGEVVDGAGGRA